MGYLLKEALKILCGQNQWSYAVFWKIGCRNSKLLIWEECYYEPLPCPFPPRDFGMSSLPYQYGNGCWESQSSQLGIQNEDRVASLINKMTVKNSVIVAGEGIIGRAAFTGCYQWILLNNFPKDVFSPEVYAEMQHQFSAGMKTVAVIPVLPHGVVQLGSFLPIMENTGFVNDMKSLILQLACIPGALLSEDYSARLSIENLAGPATAGVPASVDPPVITSNSTPSVANGSNQQSNQCHDSRPIVRAVKEINTFQGSTLTPQTHNLNQVSNNLCQPKVIPISNTSFAGRRHNRAMEAEVISSNLDSFLQQHSVSYNAERSEVNNNLSCSEPFSQSGLSDCSLKIMQQGAVSTSGNCDHVNCVNTSSNLIMSQLKTNGGDIISHSLSSGITSFLDGIPVNGEMSTFLRANLITSSGLKASTADLSGVQEVGIGLQNDDSTKPRGYSLSNLTGQSVTFPMHVENSDQKIYPADLKCSSTDQKMDQNLLQAPVMHSIHVEKHEPISDHVHKDVTSQSTMTKNPTHKLACSQPPSGDDLFDVLGADFKNSLLKGNLNELLTDELDSVAENIDKKSPCMNMHGTDPYCYSVNEAISDSCIFSGMRADNLLDAVVLKAKSVVKQNSEDISCKTTLTSNSTSSVPSPASKRVMSGHSEGGMFDFPKIGSKTGAVETNFLRYGYRKDDAGNCSQTSSICGSQLSSWIEDGGNVKRESSVSTGYSKRPDEACKPKHKRLKQGENPKPRPKDRQMIQDRVKELREIVPNGAKCSIDSLLERTIKHMLFLQSVSKHADKLKQTGESKIINKEGGLILKENLEGGATWAYEVGSQSTVCPIIVENLNHPRQMLVELLCEERGFFLEIPDFIRGLGLTILKGVMEAHSDKIWARFAVEANRDVTRMEIFTSLVRLLEQTAKGNAFSSNDIAITRWFVDNTIS